MEIKKSDSVLPQEEIRRRNVILLKGGKYVLMLAAATGNYFGPDELNNRNLIYFPFAIKPFIPERYIKIASLIDSNLYEQVTAAAFNYLMAAL